ncbi:MAG: hypothetical protein KC635_19675 [Myxococcales bacterium]|nr:hypothetical protein [Myxococcales bacterium]
MSDSLAVAVYGAAGALGKEVRVGLEGSELDIEKLVAVGGVASTADTIPWHGKQIAVIAPPELVPGSVDVAILAAPAHVAAAETARLRAHDVLVVDLSGGATIDGAPLPVVWPPVAREALERHPGGFALPCAAASTLAPVLAAITGTGLRGGQVDVVELAAATDAGQKGSEALSRQTVGLLSYQLVDAAPFSDSLAFNVLSLDADDDAARAARTEREVRELVPGVARCRATTLRIPVFLGTVVVVTARFPGQTPDAVAIAAALDEHPDLNLVEDTLSLRDAGDSDVVLVTQPVIDGDTVRVFAAADPLHRIGTRVAMTLELVANEDLW